MFRAPELKNIDSPEPSEAIDDGEATSPALPVPVPIPTPSTTTSPLIQQEQGNANVYLQRLLQSLVFGAPGIGILLNHFPSMWAVRRFGARWVVAGALLASAALTAITPFILQQAEQSYAWPLTVIRLGLGICFAPAFTLIGGMTANWATLKEQLLFLVCCVVAIQMAPVCSWLAAFHLMTLAPITLTRTFLFHAAISSLILLLWLLLYRDTPQKHRWVGGIELNRIMTGKAQNNRLLEPNAGRLIVRSVSVLIIWTCSFGYFLAVALLTQFFPFYIYKILKQPLNAGAVHPFALLALVHLIAYVINLYCQRPTTSSVKVRLFNTAAYLPSAVLFVALAALPSDDFMAGRSLLLLWLCLAPLGMVTGGLLQSAVVCGRFYTQHIVAHLQVPFGLALMLSPVLVFMVAADGAQLHWRLVFLTVAGVLSLSTVLFLIFGRGKVTGWAENSWDPSASYKMGSTRPTPSRLSMTECGVVEMRTIEEYRGADPQRVALIGMKGQRDV